MKPSVLRKIRIVYNFHHGHHQLDRFGELLELMLPYLSAININGMKVEGPKIITLGQGDRELEMLRASLKPLDMTDPSGFLVIPKVRTSRWFWRATWRVWRTSDHSCRDYLSVITFLKKAPWRVGV